MAFSGVWGTLSLKIGYSVLDIGYSLFLLLPQGKPLDASFRWHDTKEKLDPRLREDDRKEALYFIDWTFRIGYWIFSF